MSVRDKRSASSKTGQIRYRFQSAAATLHSCKNSSLPLISSFGT
jgi:ribosomal protein L32